MKGRQDAAKWNIKSTDAVDYLLSLKEEDSLPLDAQFSVLKNSLRDPYEIAEQLAATGEKDVLKVVTFPLRREALFETTAMLETEVKFNNEDDLVKTVSLIYKDHIKPAIQGIEKNKTDELFKESALEAKLSLSRVTSNTADPNNPIDALAIKVRDSVKARIDSKQYIPGEYFPTDQQEIVQTIVSDQMYKQKVAKLAKEIVDPIINKIIDEAEVTFPKTSDKGLVSEAPLERLSKHINEERHTFLVVGAPATGKTTSMAFAKKDAQEYGLQWNDTVKIDTDVHRKIVSSGKELGENATLHSNLNNDEAYAITLKAYERVNDQLKKGNLAHHLVIDAVYPSKSRIELGVRDEGNLHVYVATTPVEVSVDRAYVRGKETGRYISTDYLLQSHQGVSKDFHKNITEHLGKKIDYSIFNTDVPQGQNPKLIEAGDLSTKEVTVYNLTAAASFYAKKNINVNSKSLDDLYPKSKADPILDYNMMINTKGLKVKVETDSNSASRVNNNLIQPSYNVSGMKKNTNIERNI